MKGKGSIALSVLGLFMLAGVAGAVPKGEEGVPESNTFTIVRPIDTSSQSEKTPLYAIHDQSTGDAAAKWDGEKVRLEALSLCNPGWSKHSASAQAVYAWTGRADGMTAVKVEGGVWGEILPFTGIAGMDSGEAKVALEIQDTTTGELALSDTLFKQEAPNIVEKRLEQETIPAFIKGENLGGYRSFEMVKGHIYRATVKLTTECHTYGFYSVRVDFSRHTISNKNDLIGMVLVRQLTLKDFQRRD